MRHGGRDLSPLHYLYFSLMLLTLAGILSVALVLQFAGGEIPCPLCLLQRLAMFGVCLGLVLDFRCGFSARNTGVAMLFAALLLVVSVRQTLIDIYPRPGHEYIGRAVFGIHMPVWSVLIAAALLFAFAFKLAVLGGGDGIAPLKKFARTEKLANTLSLFVIFLCLINLLAVLLQCGFGECHTYEYRLLR